MKHNSKHIDDRMLLYVARNASECMNAAVDFMRSNWRVLFRYALIVMLPVCVVQTVGMVSIVEAAFSKTAVAPFSEMITIGILGWIGFILLNTLIWSLVKLYHERPDGLATVTGRVFSKVFFRMLGRMFVASVAIIIIVLPTTAFFMIVTMLVPFAVFFILVAVLPVLLIAPIYALEEVSVFTAIKRAFSLGFRNFGTLIVMSVTLMVMAFVLQSVTMIPWAILMALKSTFFDSGTMQASTWEIISKVLFNLFTVLMFFAIYISTAMVLISGGYLYGSAVQEGEDISLVTDIDNFENL